MSNRLAGSTSPYLLQHADNPVDWFEWGEEAFAEARRRQVPILLSVGYSSCHWCHVMAHESFEDPATAAEMNELFVNVKVDREERPDVDNVYMEAVQAMTGHGGWPMTVWLTPDLKPFYAGTYFPATDRQGMPSFRKVMAAVADAWASRQDDVAHQAERVVAALARQLPPTAGLPADEALPHAYNLLRAGFDPAHGGFGSAPKFPQQPSLEFLLRVWDRPFAPEARSMLTKTLEAMAAGGIHDQLGGGFARYSVDVAWVVPHFEKMLYDNAQLARLYLWAGLEFDRPDFVAVARRTLDYLLSDLHHPDGGFYSAEDADSEGVEGKFYVWDHAEFTEVAGADAELAAAHYGVTAGGNFEGVNILRVATGIAQLASQHGLDPAQAEGRLEAVRKRLAARRSSRTRPGLDDKVIASWNGLAIRAFAEAGAALGESRYLAAAAAAANFVIDRLGAGGGLLRTWAKGRPGKVAGFLDDYTAMGTGLLTLFAATGDRRWFVAASGLAAETVARFADGDGGFYVNERSDGLPKRPRDLFDNPSPAGNSLAAELFLLLSLYTGEEHWRSWAEGALRAAGAVVESYPGAAGHALAVLAAVDRGTHELAIAGPGAPGLAAVYWRRYRPHIALAASAEPDAGETVPLLHGRYRPGETLAYLCSGFTCLAPVAEATALEEELART
jgi:uncharacterized protein YyaL (SSP411 family)